MNWYYNSHSGAVEDHGSWSLFQVQVHLGVGWHGPFPSEQAAFDYYNANKAANPGWAAPRTTQPTTLGTGPLQTTQMGASAAAKAVTNAVTNDLFHGLNLQSWLIRIGEILLGLVLIGVSLAKLTGTSNVISKALKVGALA